MIGIGQLLTVNLAGARLVEVCSPVAELPPADPGDVLIVKVTAPNFATIHAGTYKDPDTGLPWQGTIDGQHSVLWVTNQTMVLVAHGRGWWIVA